MRNVAYNKLSEEQAKKILSPADYETYKKLMQSSPNSSFVYTNRFGRKKTYLAVRPVGFFMTPGWTAADIPGRTYLWAYHSAHGKKESFILSGISPAEIIPSLIDAIMDPSTFANFWYGENKWKESLEEDVITDLDRLRAELAKLEDIPDKDKLVLEWLKSHVSSTTTTIAGTSTTIEHEAYTVYVDDIPVYFDSLEDSVVTLVREMVSGAPLPKMLKDQIVGIQIVAEDAPGGPDVIAMSADGFVTIFGDRQVDIGVIAHESAHDFAVRKWGNPIPPEDSDYIAAINSEEPPVSEYSKRNASEDFAEATRMYTVDKQGLQATAPRRYEVIDRLMKDQEYGG